MNIGRIAMLVGAPVAAAAVGYAAGAAGNDPAEPEQNLVDVAGPAGVVLGITGLLGGVTGEIPRTGATAIGLAGVAMLAGTIIGEARDGQPY